MVSDLVENATSRYFNPPDSRYAMEEFDDDEIEDSDEVWE